MNCTDINTHIDDFLDGELDDRSQTEFQQHIAGCERCADKVEQMTSMLRDFRYMEVPAPSGNFEQRVFDRVRREFTRAQSSHFAAGFITAMAASLALWFASSVYLPEKPAMQAQPISVAINEAQTVRLMFEAKSDIRQVSLSIDLPENMVLKGYPGQQQLSWQTSLRKGPNVLALPIMAVGEGQGELVAQLSYGDKIRTFRVVLKASSNGAMQYHLEPTQSV